MGGETEAQRGTQPCPTSFSPPPPGRTMSSCRVRMAVLVGRARENWQLIRGKLGQGSARPQAVGGRGPGTALPHPPPLEPAECREQLELPARAPASGMGEGSPRVVGGDNHHPHPGCLIKTAQIGGEEADDTSGAGCGGGGRRPGSGDFWNRGYTGTRAVEALSPAYPQVPRVWSRRSGGPGLGWASGGPPFMEKGVVIVWPGGEEDRGIQDAEPTLSAVALVGARA